MRKLFALLLVICMALAAVPGTAEQENTGDCSGKWYMVYVNVTIGEMALEQDGTYRMILYSQNTAVEGSWTLENGTVTLTPQDGDASAYTFDGTQLVPEGFDISFAIRREPGRITDKQLNDYVAGKILPEGISEEEMLEIIQGVYNASDPGTDPDAVFGDFAGVWTDGGGNYLTIWGKNVTAAFPSDGEIQTGYYGNPGEWTREGNTLINADGTILVLKSDGNLLCSESSGMYTFTRVFEQSAVSTGASAGNFTGAWKGIGVLITDASGAMVYAPIAGYDLKIRKENIYTLFENTVSEYAYDIAPGSGTLSYTDADNRAAVYSLYQDGTLRWALSDTTTVVFRKAGENETVSLYTVSGPVFVPAGTSAAYTVHELAGQRTFTWSAEGDGITIDPDTGILTVTDDTAPDTAFTVTATPSDGDTPVTVAGSVCSGIPGLDSFEMVSLPYSRGFAVPTASAWGKPVRQEDKTNGKITFHYETEEIACDQEYTFIRLDSFPDAEAYYRQIRDGLEKEESCQIRGDKVTEIDGAPVYLLCITAGGNETDPVGIIYSIRENTLLVMTLACAVKGDIPGRITLNDMETIAKQIVFDPAQAPVRKADGELEVTAKGNPESMQAGKTLTFTAAFANAAAVKKDKADALVWSVKDMSTGEAPEGITIDAKGVLAADKDLTEIKHIEVTASSEMFGTQASCEISVNPVIRKLAADPKTVVLYTNSEDSAEIRIQAEPDVELGELGWTVKPQKIAEVVPGENGTAVLKPLEIGRGTLTAREPGGKTVEINVTVMKPVETIGLTSSGDAVPGGTVRMITDIRPQDAGNKKAEWSLDVGDEIATVDENGRVRIKKEAPAGTVITVTCTVYGAKEPVVQSVRIEVTEK